MSPDDPRHGTNAGYLQHVFAHETACQPCRLAHNEARRNVWRKRYAKRVDRLYIDALGSIRRIRALMAIGWRLADIDEAAGYTARRANWAHNITSQGRVHVDTAEKVARVYDRLCMTPGPSDRLRAMSARSGWAPPLAWDNIDDPLEQPRGLKSDRDQTSVDPVVVERLLSGVRTPSTRAEKVEALRRWLRSGRSEKALCRMHGWREGRYVTRDDESEAA